MRRHRQHARPRGGEPALQFHGEQQGRQLRVMVGARRLVGPALPVEVVEVEAAEPLSLRGDGHDAFSAVTQVSKLLQDNDKTT